MNIVKKWFEKTGLSIIRSSTFERLVENEQTFLHYQAFLAFASSLNSDYVKLALDLLPFSKAEIFQDIFAVLCLDKKEPGFFVEFGATDGVHGSNSWLLEKKLGWKGILAEPGHGWQRNLARNRRCIIETDCVWKETGRQLQFRQTSDAGFSTLSPYVAKDRHYQRRERGQSYLVKTVSLHDMLVRWKAPKAIDYLSIDTEGSEYDILSTFPFSDWDISVLTVEHNFREDRPAMQMLMRDHGFIRVLSHLSQFDDWYIAPRMFPHLNAAFNEIDEALLSLK